MGQEGHEGRRKRFERWLSTNWWIILILILAGGFICGYIITHYQLKTPDKYSIFVDLILIFLALIAAVGYGVYRLISQRIQRESAEIAEMRTRRALASSINNQGFYYFWRPYKRSKDAKSPDISLLGSAIEVTREAYYRYAIHLDEKDRSAEEVICGVSNNLAYYLTEWKVQVGSLHEEGDEKLIHACANYIEDRIVKYPAHTKVWADTINFVDEHCPSRREKKNN